MVASKALGLLGAGLPARAFWAYGAALVICGALAALDVIHHKRPSQPETTDH
jgi:hypothetical protein